jgi:hypothetical protein
MFAGAALYRRVGRQQGPPVVVKGSWQLVSVGQSGNRARLLRYQQAQCHEVSASPFGLAETLDWGDDVVRLTNDQVEVEVAVAFGPRVLRYGFVGGSNVFGDASQLATDTAFGPWRPVGGHRLWVAPERLPGSYAPDSVPVAYDVPGPLRGEFRAPIDAAGMQKTLVIEMGPTGTAVLVTHLVSNRTCWPVRVAPWAITVVDPNGTAVLPQPEFRSHAENFLPVRRLVQWSYTDLTDRRWRIGRRLLGLTPDPALGTPQKIGAANVAGWCALVRDDCSFVKQTAWVPGVEYPDLGCSTEFYTAGDYLEVETLAPLQLLEPGASATHTEKWHLSRSITRRMDEAELERAIHTLLSQSATNTL